MWSHQDNIIQKSLLLGSNYLDGYINDPINVQSQLH